jgi:hypothetical protein
MLMRLVRASRLPVEHQLGPDIGRITLPGISRVASAMNTSPVQCIGMM